jgi:hypothetical protein
VFAAGEREWWTALAADDGRGRHRGSRPAQAGTGAVPRSRLVAFVSYDFAV